MDGERNFITIGEGHEARKADWTGCKMW